MNKAVEINNNLRRLRWLREELEAQYIENEGEVTETTEQMEEEIALIESILTDAPDELGRYMVSIEDSVQRDKAEEKAIAARRKRKESFYDFLKDVARKLIVSEPDRTQIKGDLYTFKASVSTKTTPNYAALEEEYMERINEALDGLNLPTWMTISIDASVKVAKADGPLDERFFTTQQSDSLTFTKPRRKKEDGQTENA